MAQRTLKGYQLSEAVRGPRGHLAVDVGVCSLICRAAVTYLRVQEGYCNGSGAHDSPYFSAKEAGKMEDRFQKGLERKEAQLEKHIQKLAAQLPGVKGVHFGGDPRGATIKLVMKNGRTDDWGTGGDMRTRKLMEGLTGKIQAFAALVELQQAESIERQYPNGPDYMKPKVTIKPGRKYTKVDVGDSGRFMVDNDTGGIFGIKGYGVIHRGRYYKTLDDTAEFWWGEYGPIRGKLRERGPE